MPDRQALQRQQPGLRGRRRRRRRLVVPGGPFAELLRRAFAPELDAGACRSLARMHAAAEPAALALGARWQTEVIDRFASRYALWQA